MTKISSTGYVVRIEPDGFGIVQDAKTSKAGYFTRTSVKTSASRGKIRKGSRVRFVAEDEGKEILFVASVELDK